MFADLLGRRTGALGAILACTAFAGCTVEAGGSPPPPVVVEPGRLTLRWTVSESVDPNLCVLGRAAAIDIAISTLAERSAGEFQAPCTAFATSISTLYPGDYVADALLIDVAGRARTTNVSIRPFTIIERTELVVDVDFPADSFLDGVERDAVGRAVGTARDGARLDEWSARASGNRESAPPAVKSAPTVDPSGPAANPIATPSDSRDRTLP